MCANRNAAHKQDAVLPAARRSWPGSDRRRLFWCGIESPNSAHTACCVRAGSLFSIPTAAVSYSPPSVASIFGCTSLLGAPLNTVNCSRNGGQLLTVRGTNFGAADAKVFVGNAACTNLVHDPATPNELLTCTLPSGNSQAPLLLLQNNGVANVDIASVTYTLVRALARSAVSDCSSFACFINRIVSSWKLPTARSAIRLPGLPTSKASVQACANANMRVCLQGKFTGYFAQASCT